MRYLVVSGEVGRHEPASVSAPLSTVLDELVEETIAVLGLLQYHITVVAQEPPEELTLQPHQLVVGIKETHHVAAVVVAQQLLQALELHLGVVDGHARGIPTNVGSLRCSASHSTMGRHMSYILPVQV